MTSRPAVGPRNSVESTAVVLLAGDCDDALLVAVAAALEERGRRVAWLVPAEGLDVSVCRLGERRTGWIGTASQTVDSDDICSAFCRLQWPLACHADSFAGSECMAALWAFFSSLSCPVLNGPTRYGFFPPSDPFLLLSHQPSSISYSFVEGTFGGSTKTAVSLDLATLQMLGTNVGPARCVRRIGFSGTNVRHILVAGDDLIDLSLPSPSRGDCFENQGELMRVLSAVGFGFGALAVEATDDRVQLLHYGTLWPPANWFQHRFKCAVDSIVRYLDRR